MMPLRAHVSHVRSHACIRSRIELICLGADGDGADPRPKRPVVVTTGEGVVKRAPDRAWVDGRGRIAREGPARSAERSTSDAMSGVIDKLKAAGLPADAIKTTGYDLQPEFDYANDRQTLRGYVARNSVEVRVDDLAEARRSARKRRSAPGRPTSAACAST